MSARTTTELVLPFVARMLEREGAAVEPVGDDALFTVLPDGLAGALDLPAAATLDLAGSPAGDRHAFPLEGPGMQHLIERARARGRRAGAILPDPVQHPSGRLEKAMKQLALPNAKLVDGEVTRPGSVRYLLEFGYEARAEERTEGRVLVAVTERGVASTALADVLVDALSEARATAPAASEGALQAAVACARPLVERAVDRALAPFRATCLRRLHRERDRIVAYHDNLAREARRRKRRGADPEALESKRAAILRRRAERLDELEARHAISTSYWLASVLTVRYPVTLCRLRIKRRRTTLELAVEWDPILRAFLGPPCDACKASSMYARICDAAGHATCEACSTPCDACGRISCRACGPAGCGCKPRVDAAGEPN